MATSLALVRVVFLLTILSAILCVFLDTCSARQEPKYDIRSMVGRYEAWQKKYGRIYANADEWNTRFGIYQSNVQYIDSVNSKNLTYKLDDNQFADMTTQEISATYCGCKWNSSDTYQNYSKSTLLNSDVPVSVDWRKMGAVNPVKFQHECGACWAFATAASIEGITQIKTGTLMSLSEQMLLDCTTYFNEGCRGGRVDFALEYVVNNGGITTEENYPYVNRKGGCDANKINDHAATITAYVQVPELDELALEAAVAMQPVAVLFDSNNLDFRFYKSGIFTADCGTTLDHALTVVGYDVEEGTGAKYWIMRNSWGVEWGEEGYVKVLKQVYEREGKCGLAISAFYPVKE